MTDYKPVNVGVHEELPMKPLLPPAVVKCSNGCGADVRVMYPHELQTGVTCTDCFERMTTT